MITRSSAREVARLVADLIGDDEPTRVAAAARLAIIGPRSVDRLLAALSGAPAARDRAAILSVLERIGDPRAVRAAEAALGDEAAVAVGAIAVLRAQLQSPDRVAARRALDLLADVAVQADRPSAVRLAAVDALQELPSDVVAPLIAQLQRDGDPLIRRRAGAVAEPQTPDTARAAPPDASDEAPADPAALQALAADRGASVPLAVLHRLVVHARAREEQETDAALKARWRVARGAVHQALAARRSRVAVYDLRETLESSRERLPIGMLAALRALADRTLLEAMADAIARSTDAWTRTQLTDIVREVVARERLTSRHRTIGKLSSKYPGLFG